MSDITILLYGALGGLLPDILKIIENRYTGEFPGYFKKLMFWIGLILMVALGSLCAYLFEPEKPVNAIALGFAAPRILRDLASKPEKKLMPEKFEIRKWWR